MVMSRSIDSVVTGTTSAGPFDLRRFCQLPKGTVCLLAIDELILLSLNASQYFDRCQIFCQKLNIGHYAMPRILVSASFDESLLARQTPGGRGVWGEYQYLFEPDGKPVDGWLIYDD